SSGSWGSKNSPGDLTPAGSGSKRGAATASSLRTASPAGRAGRGRATSPRLRGALPPDLARPGGTGRWRRGDRGTHERHAAGREIKKGKLATLKSRLEIPIKHQIIRETKWRACRLLPSPFGPFLVLSQRGERTPSK